MDTPAVLPKYYALIDYGQGLYAGFETHTHRLAEVVARVQRATLLLWTGEQYPIDHGQVAAAQPYPAHQDPRFVWTPYA